MGVSSAATIVSITPSMFSLNVRVPYTQDPEALLLQVSLAPRISRDLSIRAVRSAIDLDDQPAREAREVDDEMIDGHLLAELAADLFQLPQLAPQPAFGAGAVAAQTSRVLVRAAPPLTSLHRKAYGTSGARGSVRVPTGHHCPFVLGFHRSSCHGGTSCPPLSNARPPQGGGESRAPSVERSAPRMTTHICPTSSGTS